MRTTIRHSPILHPTHEPYHVPNEDAGWVNLRNAIIEQAANDYIRIASSKRQNHSELRQIEKFFLGGHCDFLLAGADLTGAEILDRLREKAKELREKRGIIDVEPQKIKGDEE